MADSSDRLLAELAHAVHAGTLRKLTLGAPRGSDPSLERVIVRPVLLRAGPRLSFVWRHKTKDVTKNHTHEDGVALVAHLLAAEFATAHLMTSEATFQLEARPGRPPALSRSAATHAGPPSLAHDRAKTKPLDEAGARWLHALGVTTEDGKTARGMQGKLRQIQRFVEVLESLLAELAPRGVLELVDMGCGKGYLTFAACDWLRSRGIPARVRGVEARPELVAEAGRIALEQGFAELTFEVGTIADTELHRLDVLLALHACDTATDDAIAKGIAAGAGLIVVAPCCHKEVRQGLTPPFELEPALRHGILLERHCELVTDALRAGLLEHAGYATKVFEFVATEHTRKNLMIAATRRASAAAPAGALAEVARLARFHGVEEQRLARSLGVDLRADKGTAPGSARSETIA